MTDETPMEWDPLEEQLREKIKEWRDHDADPDEPAAVWLEWCADEIEELIE
jgi:hypothetical protein